MGKVCSKAHGLRYADDDYFIGTRLGPEGKCLSSEESICQSDCNSVLKLKSEECFETSSGYKYTCTEPFKERGSLFGAGKPSDIEDCDLIVDLPPEGQKDDKLLITEVETPMKTDAEDQIRFQKTEEVKDSYCQAKPNRNEWSYTVYDIDGGSKVTQQDLSQVMNSIRTAIDETVDHSAQTPSKDMKMLKIKVAIGHHENHHENSGNKSEKKPQLGFNRMLLPPPDSEEAELLCYYIREKLLTYANQEKNSTRETSQERKRSKPRVREGSNSRSPDISSDALQGNERRKVSPFKTDNEMLLNDGLKETNFTSPTPPVCCQSKRDSSAANDLRHPQLNRPFYGLPQRQDTYGGPVDTQTERVRCRSRQTCPPSSGTRSPQIFMNDIEPRGWTSDHSYEATNQERVTASKHSSFCHKDAYRESREGGSPRKSKRATRKGQSEKIKGQTSSCGRIDPFQAPPWSVPRERRSNPSKVCPCKYRGGRYSRDKKRNPSTSIDRDESTDTMSTHTGVVTAATTKRNESPSRDEVFLRDDVVSSDGANSRDEKVATRTESNIYQRSRHESGSSADSRTDEGVLLFTDLRTDKTNAIKEKSTSDSRNCSSLRLGEDATASCSSAMQNARLEGSKSLDDFSKPRRNIPVVDNSSNESSTEVSHSSSWKDQISFGTNNTCHRFVHEWNDDVELSTSNMMNMMQEQEARIHSGSQSPRTQDINMMSSKNQVHKHEHYHYHYHIFKRS
ncbi:uncharacterized protein LOC135690800 [Rhopilema esculentum]|uniref:uncharacterized protein LOC135690800 n=1 Tax=Rhopilema esculentum TaxID=499914 RepID=UPI0031D9D356